jgi:predicted nucleic acid-binding protein
MRFVLDCSVAISWCFSDESNSYADAVLVLLTEDAEAVVPGIFWLEIVNVLLVSERRKRITAQQITEALTLLRSLPISVSSDVSPQSTDTLLTIARENNLAAYDAAYLELTIRENLLLATID